MSRSLVEGHWSERTSYSEHCTVIQLERAIARVHCTLLVNLCAKPEWCIITVGRLMAFTGLVVVID